MTLLKPGDWLVLSVAIALFALSWFANWQQGAAEKALIRSRGQVFAEVGLSRDQRISVPGPLGGSVIEIRKGLARIESDPSPRQYCVKQGWLQNAGDIAVCLPNQVSLELVGSARRYDSINY